MQHLDQLLSDWGSALGPAGEALFKLILAMVLGGAVGVERELRGRKAGFRTNLLVCLGSTLAMIVSMSFATKPWHDAGAARVQVDPSRIAYGIMVGIGFLGSGTISRSEGSVHGLTTAAALWCVTAVGLAIGFGQYLLAIIATVLVVSALTWMAYIEEQLPRTQNRLVVLRRRWEPGCIEATIKRFARPRQIVVCDVSFYRVGEDLDKIDIHMAIAFTRDKYYRAFEHQVEADPEHEMISQEAV